MAKAKKKTGKDHMVSKAAGMTIEFSDDGPDREDRRRFTLTWPVEPRWEGFPLSGPMVLVTRRGQCFNSAQWRGFLKQGAIDVTKGKGAAKVGKAACSFCGSTKAPLSGDDVHPGYTGFPVCPTCKAV